MQWRPLAHLTLPRRIIPITLMRIHIEPIGGLAGKMFATAMFDAKPELADGLDDVVILLGPQGSVLPSAVILATAEQTFTDECF